MTVSTRRAQRANASPRWAVATAAAKRHVADGEFADPVGYGHPVDGGILGDLGGHFGEDRLGAGMRFVDEPGHPAAAVVVAHDARRTRPLPQPLDERPTASCDVTDSGVVVRADRTIMGGLPETEVPE